MVSEDAESIAVECKNISLSVLEPNCTLESPLACECYLYASDIGILLILFIILGVSDKDHRALRTVIEQNMFVGVLAAACIVIFGLDFAL